MTDPENKDAPLELREDGQLYHAGQKVVGYVDDDGAYHNLKIQCKGCDCPVNKAGRTLHYTSCSNVNVLAPDYQAATQEEINEALRNG